jgi:hypothetical protein
MGVSGVSIKYMGSKRVMLTNGFGHTIVEEAKHADRVVDLFSGSAVVAWFAAEATSRPVHAFDLQEYSAVLARAVIGRTRRVEVEKLHKRWLQPIREALNRSPLREEPRQRALSAKAVREARRRCADDRGSGTIWRAYGGHYFAPNQALALDLALSLLPDREPHRSVCRAAVIAAAAYCAAAPGHTAQPFQPTKRALGFIEDSWRRDPLRRMESWLEDVAERHARQRGEAAVADALVQARQLGPGDLAIVDPPYSAVQYSRFYHVLEAVADGRDVEVEGVGRYPPRESRPSSRFSLRMESEAALIELLDSLAEASCRVLLTFPAGSTSNGLSGARLTALAKERFDVSVKTILGRFSTMGGNNESRASRHASAELILTLRPA